MAKVPDRRRARRIKAGFEVFFDSAREGGPAILADVSSVGALLEQAQSRPRVGASVRMTMLPNSSKRLQLAGHVIRHTEAGFAIEFERLNPRVYHLLIEGAASGTSVEESDRGDVATLELEEVGVDDEAGVGSLRLALELILEAALDGRRGDVEPEEALDIIIDRVRELDEAAG